MLPFLSEGKGEPTPHPQLEPAFIQILAPALFSSYTRKGQLPLHKAFTVCPVEALSSGHQAASLRVLWLTPPGVAE